MGEIVLAALATFGLSALVVNYDGAFDLFLKLRNKFKVFRCVVCLSVWVAPVILLLLAFGQHYIVWIFAVIGAVIITERLT